jgi:hypothetical protein
MTRTWHRPLFVVAALYDGILGVAFFLAWPAVFRLFEVTPPNHGGYVQFSAALLILFAFLFMRIARDPAANRDLICYGMGLKVTYSGLVFWYQATAGVPFMWVPFAWLDLAFLAAFVLAWRELAGGRSPVIRGA